MKQIQLFLQNLKTRIHAAKAFPDNPLQASPAACTIELRGKCDVNQLFGKQDAKILFGFF